MTPYQNCLTAMYGLRRFGIKLGLETIESILSALGNPQRNFRSIHIAGTNGKGSVAAMLSTILHRAGYRVGRYTSPHLERFNERICIDDRPIDDAAVIRAYQIVAKIKDLERQPTFFEFATAMALSEFGSRSVDWGIIETGMGGRLDATNAIQPDLTIITNISLEHRNYLGHTIAAIAAEKAGIIKPAVPVVTAVRQKSARGVILDQAARLKAPAYLKSRDFNCRRREENRFTYFGMDHTWRDLGLGLNGTHQVENASLVLAACEILQETGTAHIPIEAIIQGLDNAHWPGRLEVVNKSPEIILDGAHNRMAARTLAQHLVTHYSDRAITLVVGILDDKPSDIILKDLIGPCQKVVITQPKIDRAIPAGRLASLAKRHIPSVSTIPDVGQAVRYAIKSSRKEDVICVAGSLYVVGEAKTVLREIKLA